MPDDRLAIHELLALHGHVFDDGELDRLGELFTDDVVYDVGALGGEPLEGVDAIRDAALALGERNPLAHHVTNVVVVSLEGDEAHVVAKGLSVAGDGSAASVVYEDEVRRTPDGWRIARRAVRPRLTPLQR